MSPLVASTAFVRPLEDEWRSSIDRVLDAHRWPTTREPEQLGALVRALSDAYNAPVPPPGRAVASSGPAIAARLGFSFARDVPKAAAAVRELIGAGELGKGGEGPLRVLDLGCGLGATTWGVARALAASGVVRPIEATWTDEDVLALDVARELASNRGRRAEGVTLAVNVERRSISLQSAGREPWNLILLGQVLSELDRADDLEERTRSHALLLGSLVSKLAPNGAVVVVEPALRDRTRHLHAVRDAVLASRAASVFAPCLHAGRCPALEVPGEWCHEDVAVDLPPWLEPVARAAGLRWQGLTFSYLVLRRPHERTLPDFLPKLGAISRVISGPLVSKGKREHFVCAPAAPAAGEEVEGGVGARTRLSRLDRDEDEANVTWSSLARGDVVSIDPAPDRKTKNRIVRGVRVTRLEPAPTAAPVEASAGALSGAALPGAIGTRLPRP